MGGRAFLVGLTLALVACKRQEVDVVPRRYPPPLPNGGAVYFVGNSFFAWEGRELPEWVAALGAADGVSFRVGGDLVPGDRPLGAFFHDPSVQAALASRKFQVWVLQAHEFEPVDHPEEFRRAVEEFDRAIRAAGGRTVLFQTWEFRWRKFLPELVAGIERVAQPLSLPVIPAGQVYRDLGDAPPPGMGPFFLTADPEHPEGDLHENALGTAVNTYVTYATLTGRDPAGRRFVTHNATVAAELLPLFSGRAWARAEERLVLAGRRPQ